MSAIIVTVLGWMTPPILNIEHERNNPLMRHYLFTCSNWTHMMIDKQKKIKSYPNSDRCLAYILYIAALTLIVNFNFYVFLSSFVHHQPQSGHCLRWQWQENPAHLWTDLPSDYEHWPTEYREDTKIFTPYHRHHWLQLHSELIWGELHRLHQQEKQINTPHTAQIHETRHKEIDIFEQPQLSGLVWELQDLVDQRWSHLCRPTLPHPSPQMNPRYCYN